MLAFFIYCTAVALLLGIAGIAMERIAGWRRWARRGIWSVTLIASLALPATMALRPHSTVAPPPAIDVAAPVGPFRAVGRSEPINLRVPEVPKPIPSRWLTAAELPSFDRACEILWLVMSGGVFGVFALSWARLHRQGPHWQHETVGGYKIWVTPALGPAVVGFVRPRILVPQWIMDAPVATRSIMLIHESEHIVARDPLLLLVGLVAVFLMPWNLPLWWQLHRLRFAVEVDCDVRVLRRDTDVQTYGNVLLTISQLGAHTPLGAMAIAAPISQLERRVLIMTALGPRPNRWLYGAAAALVIGCACLAADLQAPTLSDSALRKSPLHDWSPFLPKAEAAAHSAYPDLFAGRFNGTVVLLVNLNRDGAVLGISRRELPPGPLADDALQFDTEFIADGYHVPGSAGRRFLGWYGPHHKNGLYMFYQVLKWPHDPTRSAARVRAAVAAQYPEFFRAYPPSQSFQNTKATVLTVFMNDDGSISRANVEDADSKSFDEKHRFNRFARLGLSPEQFGHRGWTTNFQDSHHLTRYPNAPFLEIDYAWPRRADDPLDVAIQSNAIFRPAFDGMLKEQKAQPSDAAFLKRYFLDIWEHGQRTTTDLPWILVDRDGVVCDHGVSRTSGFPDLRGELLKRYPGTSIGLNVLTASATAHGSRVQLAYMTLEDDSPLTACQEITDVHRIE